MNNITEKFRVAVKKYELLKRHDHVLVGFSGGPDSVMLALLLKQISKEFNLTLVLGYANHQLRGKESQAEELFVKKFAVHQNIQLKIKRILPRLYAKKQKLSLEEAARILRYKFFEEAALKSNCKKIALAHHLDDNAETVLHNLIRGTSLEGLKGVPVKRLLKKGLAIEIIRPLIDIKKSEILDYLKKANVSFVSDSTNTQDLYTRNIIRNKVLTLLESINPKVKEHLAGIAADAAQWSQFKYILTQDALKKVVRQNKTLDLAGFFGYDRFLQKEIIKVLISGPKTARVLRREHIEKTIKKLQNIYKAKHKTIALRRLTGKDFLNEAQI